MSWSSSNQTKNNKRFLVACVIGACFFQALLILTYERVFHRELDHAHGINDGTAVYVPHVFQTKQTHCALLDMNQNGRRRGEEGDVLIVNVNLDHALSTAICFASSGAADSSKKVTILVVVEKLPKRFRHTTAISDHLIKLEQLDDDLPAHVNAIWYAQAGKESPQDLLNFGNGSDLQALFLSQVESDSIVGGGGGGGGIAAIAQQKSLLSFETIWIRSPCEAVHDDINKTSQFALKLHEFVHAWELALASNDDGNNNSNKSSKNNNKINWIIEECENAEYTTTLLHNSVMFRPSELQQRHENAFYFVVDVTALRHRYDLFRRDRAFLGIEQLSKAAAAASTTTKTESCRGPKCRHAYMTLLHSDGKYVCGALVMGHSIRKHDTNNDLVALVTPDTPQHVRAQLERHGWIVVDIDGIHGPDGTPPWFEFNFSKLRAWKVADELGYDKVAIVDSDLLFEKDPSILFHSQTAFAAVPQSTTVFNAGLMVFEPSRWLHDYMVSMIENLGVPYVFAEQSFLNQIFGWRMHLFDKTDMKWKKNSPGPHTDKDFMIHYFGIKPWHCPSREADCNTMEHMRIRNNDALFHHWFDVHDEMSEACAEVPAHPPGFLMGIIGPLVRAFAG